MLLIVFMFGLVTLLSMAMFASARMWFLEHWRRAHDVARDELVRFARARDGVFRLGDEVPASGFAAVEIAGCVCRASYHFRWVEVRSREKRASKCLLVTKHIRADLRDIWTDRIDPERFMKTLQRYAGTPGPHARELVATETYDPPSETLVIASEALRDRVKAGLRNKVFDVKATPRGLRFRAGPRMPLDELAETVAWYLRLYGRAVDEANRPEPKIYR